MKNKNIEVLYSWPVIILALLFCWPFGLYLIIKKVSVDRKAAIASSAIFMVFAILLYAMAGFWTLGALVCLSEPADAELVVIFFVFALIFGLGGFALHKYSKKIKKTANEVKTYLAIIVNGNETNIDAIASAIGKNYSDAKVDIQKLIDNGYLKNSYIDEGRREVILPNQVPQNDNITTAIPENSKIVTCHCCGANNKIHGEIGECEYCGSSLK